MRSDEVHTVQEFVAFCQAILAEHPENMSDEEQQAKAGWIVVLMANDEYHREWQEYPQIIDIIEAAVDLDRLDTESGGWKRIQRLVDDLEKGLK